VTLFANLRAGPYGAVCSPYLLDGDALADPPAMNAVLWSAAPILMRNRDVILATHGFNVGYVAGLRSLARFEQALAPTQDEAFMGVLWPGDWIIPAINYPFEDGVASKAGRLLADFINRWLASARSVSLISHSLGARVILSAILGSTRRIRCACITAGAINAGCLTEEFAAASANCDRIITLSSRADTVLHFAYPPGDLLADIFQPDHPPGEAAMGRDGPAAPFAAWVRAYEIPEAEGYRHSDYLPSPLIDVADAQARWQKSAQFMASAVRGRSPIWPG
jgi:hypothetical protein